MTLKFFRLAAAGSFLDAFTAKTGGFDRNGLRFRPAPLVKDRLHILTFLDRPYTDGGNDFPRLEMAHEAFQFVVARVFAVGHAVDENVVVRFRLDGVESSVGHRVVVLPAGRQQGQNMGERPHLLQMRLQAGRFNL